jgi:hypothetical protein
MSNNVNIDEVSAEVKALIGAMKSSESSAAHDRGLAQPKLQLIWKALEAKQPVSGCKTKGEWAKYAGVTPRYCQYILKDGSRKDQKRTTVRIVTLKVGMILRVGDVKITLSQDQFNALHMSAQNGTRFVESKLCDCCEENPASLPNGTCADCAEHQARWLKRSDAAVKAAATRKSRESAPAVNEPTEKELRRQLKKLIKESRELSRESERIEDYQECAALQPDLTAEKVEAHSKRAHQVIREMDELTEKLKKLKTSELTEEKI